MTDGEFTQWIQAHARLFGKPFLAWASDCREELFEQFGGRSLEQMNAASRRLRKREGVSKYFNEQIAALAIMVSSPKYDQASPRRSRSAQPVTPAQLRLMVKTIVAATDRQLPYKNYLAHYGSRLTADQQSQLEAVARRREVPDVELIEPVAVQPVDEIDVDEPESGELPF